jgi:broad specificity phosphatase PhoE
MLTNHGRDMTLTPLIGRLTDVRMRLANRRWPSFPAAANGGAKVGSAFRIHVVRHGETNANVTRRFAGQSDDSELNERGQRQSTAVAHELKRRLGNAPEGVLLLTSPSKRALQTANVIAECMGLGCTCDDAFREVNLGSWSGMTPEEISLHEKDQLERWRENKWLTPPPSGETLFDVKARMCHALLKRMSDPALRISRVILVTHFHAIQALNKQTDGANHFEPINCSITTYCGRTAYGAQRIGTARIT